MDCNLTTRDQVSEIVLKVIRDKETDPSIQEATTFAAIGVDPIIRREYFEPISNAIEAEGCELLNVDHATMQNAAKPGDIVDAVWEDVK
ncbi:MAG: hypothetical protein HOJ79_14215 [Nitrospina sp.]|jgi:hypothetical protein|nr:hypothetical protein [Nitrospina sp.]